MKLSDKELQHELLRLLNECEEKMKALAWGMSTHPDACPSRAVAVVTAHCNVRIEYIDGGRFIDLVQPPLELRDKHRHIYAAWENSL